MLSVCKNFSPHAKCALKNALRMLSMRYKIVGASSVRAKKAKIFVIFKTYKIPRAKMFKNRFRDFQLG
jgi:hypothetical protein